MNWQSVSTVLLVVLLVTSLGITGIGAADDDDLDEREAELDEREAELQQQQAELRETRQSMQDRPFVRGSPDLDVFAPNPIVQSGETNEVTVVVSNGGDLSIGDAQSRDIVTAARDVTVEAEADDPLTVRSGETSIGTVTDQQPSEVPIAIDVPDDVSAGEYSLDVDLSYTYTSQQAGDGTTYEQSRTESVSIDLEVDEEARFDIVDVETDAQIGDTGSMDVELENVGEEVATDINVAMESMSPGLGFGESAQDSARIDELEPGETATVTYDVAFPDDTSVRYYPLEGTVQFETDDGLDRVDERVSSGVMPLAEQRFTITDVHSTLRVGEDGDLEGYVTNEGPEDAENVVVQFTDESPNVIPIETGVAVDSLESGESAPFSLPVDVSGEAEAVDREIDLAVQYRNEDLQQRLFEDTAAMVGVEDQRDQFLVDVQDRQIAAGEEKLVDVEVTNNLDQTVTDVEASLFTDDPLDSDDDEGFVEELEPGETTSMTFDLEADDGATPKTYPVSFDFRYDDERGNSQLSDTTRVAIDVTESGGGIPWLAVGAILLTGLGAGAYVYQRQ
ncbi:COG1361 S-layer family protein [Natrarchaeobaculum sulfurireducens]|uniref:S-layer protein n=1 Tax=Natrarchaeobaculum sulfurireducens TaxID=2044521 RepID=A0A346PMN2_9EURY|nr:COG1361 S-layer family protein [Natrarchaeobaculum sulfurireducens]AXR80777.1 S-layer protein [Natrarchaeobaculum sulfurireducens]